MVEQEKMCGPEQLSTYMDSRATRPEEDGLRVASLSTKAKMLRLQERQERQCVANGCLSVAPVRWAQAQSREKRAYGHASRITSGQTYA